MSSAELVNEIRALPRAEFHRLLAELLSDEEIAGEIERIGYLRLTESAFEFWHDPREDVYQDYARQTSRK